MVPIIASILGAVVFFYSVYPLPPYPYNVAVLFSFTLLIIGVLMAIYYWKKHPEILTNAGLLHETNCAKYDLII
ncbi:hypothetical protein JCM16161A_22500 [Vulcanisaeta sp. JCM 16161]